MLYDFIKIDPEYRKSFSLLCETADRKSRLPVSLSGLSKSADYAYIAAFSRDYFGEKGKQTVVITGSDRETYRIFEYLISCGIKAAIYPQRELVMRNITASRACEHERLSALYKLKNGKIDVLVTTSAASASYTLPEYTFDCNTISLSENVSVSPEELCRKLTDAGYINAELVDGEGQFSHRGCIVDVYPSFDPDGTYPSPVRIEFFGDEIDRLASFDVETQRITDRRESVLIPPARELLCTDSAREEIRSELVRLIKKARNEESLHTLKGELSAAENAAELDFADRFTGIIYKEPETLFDYLETDCPVILYSENAVRDQLTASLRQNAENVKELLSEGLIDGKHAEYGIDFTGFEMQLAERPLLIINNFEGARAGRYAGLFSFRTRTATGCGGNSELLCEDLEAYVSGNYRIVIGCRGEAEIKTLAEILRDKGIAVSEHPGGINDISELSAGVVFLIIAPGYEGYELISPKFVFLSMTNGEDEGGKLLRRRMRKDKHRKGQKLTSYADLKEGDYVVHEAYGIGRYQGITNLCVDNVYRDYITIQYAGADKLFIPADQIGLVSKYIGAHSDDDTLKLSKMGGAEWNRSKARTKAAVKVMAKELIALYAERARKKGIAFPEDDAFEREFDSSFEYQETQSQTDAIEEIKTDMEKPMPMDRLLCGDVGYGKTEVALRAAFKAISAGFQVALLVPTTILAYQHFQTAMSRMQGYGIRIDMISRFRSAKEQKEILRRLERGDIDLIIGTHKLVYGDIKFHRLGLLIVDEEQRFGVAQKEKLKKFSSEIDVLSLSATPIPRTLSMALGGIRDMSILDEAPGERQPVQTYVLEHDDLIINEAIRKELARGGQVFYIYNRIETIHNIAARIKAAVPEARVAVAHGQMEREEIEDIWQSLLDREIDVLVCTTIIETGVDVPNANTLIIENADRMGLSQLHQIRGRVGRSSRHAYAYFTFRPGKVLSEIAEKRLTAIREYAQFGAGFKIALRDLEIRGAGNLLGAEQHGHLDSVGYDLYIKLLNDAVLEEKGETVPVKTECVIDIKADAFIPEKYISSSALRMEQYKRISLIETEADFLDVSDEISDRFGEYPKPVENLLEIALIKGTAQKFGIIKISEKDNELSVTPDEPDILTWAELSNTLEKYKMLFRSSAKPYIQAKIPKGKTAISAMKEILAEYEKISLQNSEKKN